MLSSLVSFLRVVFGIGAGPGEPDGFGQSIADDIRFARNFARCRRTAMVWRAPTLEESRALDADPIVGRFGDLTIGVADIAGRRWTLRERDWSGWPDPPRFVFFAMEHSQVWAGADFDRWPRSWKRPPESDQA